MRTEFLKFQGWPSRIRTGQESTGFHDVCCMPWPWRSRSASEAPSPTRGEAKRGYCVFATRGGAAVVTNEVASSMAWPSGVGIVILNGTSQPVTCIGTGHYVVADVRRVLQ